MKLISTENDEGIICNDKYQTSMIKNNCLNCGKNDNHLEGKYCSVICADLHEYVFSESDIEKMNDKQKILLGYKISR